MRRSIGQPKHSCLRYLGVAIPRNHSSRRAFGGIDIPARLMKRWDPQIDADYLARLIRRNQTTKKGPQITQISADLDSGCRYWLDPTFSFLLSLRNLRILVLRLAAADRTR